MRKKFYFLGVFLFLGLLLSQVVFSQEETFSKDDRDQNIEYFGRDGKVYDSLIEYAIDSIPSTYGRLVSVARSPFNPKEFDLWFEANNGVIRRVVLVPIKNRKPSFMIYREVLTLERD